MTALDVRSAPRTLPGASLADMPDRVLEALSVGICVCDRGGVVVRHNRAAVELWGRSPEPGDRFCGAMRLRNLDGRIVPHAESPMASVLATGVGVRGHELVIERPDGRRIITVMDIEPIDGGDGGMAGAVNVFRESGFHGGMRDSAEEVAAHRLAAIVESSDDAILAKDLNGTITSWNRGAERLFGYTPEEAVGKPVTILIPPERHDEEPTILARIRRGERVEHYETVRQRKDGGLIDISLTVSPIRDQAGRVVGASKIARDITERKRAEEQKRLLLREMAHRVKNLFAVASGVVTLSARSATTPGELAAVVRERLAALARAQALTLQEGSEGADRAEMPTTLHALIRAIVSPHEDSGEDAGRRVTVHGQDIEVGGSVLTSFALLLHEFATNAAKYGSLSTPAGRVDVECRDDDDLFILIWREQGGPVVAARPAGEGFGSELSRLTVSRQLGGEIVREWSRAGLSIRLSAARNRLVG